MTHDAKFLYRCEANAFGQVGETFAYGRLLEAVEQYFVPTSEPHSRRVCRTSLPPIYFQHPGEYVLERSCVYVATY